MNRQIAYAHSLVVAAEVVSSCAESLDGPEPLEFYRPRLEKAERQINVLLGWFLETNSHRQHKQFFGPMADAGISLREALESHFIDRDGVACVVVYLSPILTLDPRKGGRSNVA